MASLQHCSVIIPLQHGPKTRQLYLESVPLLQQMLLALAAGLHPPRGVHRPRPARSRMQHQAGEERLLDRRLRQLLGGDEVETAALELVTADVAHLRHRVLVRHAEV